MTLKEKKVPCKFCGELTLCTNTQLCNNCWEFERRIERFVSNPNGLAFVIRKIKEAKIKEWQDYWHEEISNRWKNNEIDTLLSIPGDVIDSINCDVKFEAWIKEIKKLYISDPLASEIITDAVSNKFIWLDV